MKIGIYAGSFNPFHLGHYDVLLQSQQLFDKVIVAVGNNPEKNYEQRSELPDVVIKNFEIITYDGLLTEIFRQRYNEHPDNQYFLVRGLRNGHDLEYEQNQISFMKSMYPPLKVVFFRCSINHDHISSSALRAIRKYSEEEFKKYIP